MDNQNEEIKMSVVFTEQEKLTNDLTDVVMEDNSQEDLKEELKQTKEDYTQYSKEDLFALSEKLLQEDDLKLAISVLKQIKPAFDAKLNAEKQEALQKFIADGGIEADFEFKEDENTKKFYKNQQTIYGKRTQQVAQNEKDKDKNFELKTALLDRLRILVDVEEDQLSINELKKIQEEWKKIGIVPNQHNNNLWQSYNVLIERFYDKRSIHFELKELDRKKNLSLKIVLCEKAEELAKIDGVKDALRELKNLHEEYKHIGPVPKEEQELLWQRFKNASDLVYDKRKAQNDLQKAEKDKNLEIKNAICAELEEASNFQSDKIAAWNTKTKEILDIQKRWEAIRFIPEESIKDASKRFWAAFKHFFHGKNLFFKDIEKQRNENLKRKVELCELAEQAVTSEDSEQRISQTLKDLQKQWKEVGPAPIKQKDAIFERFKKACDGFFEGLRKQQNSVEAEYEENLKRKLDICAKIKELDEKSADSEQVLNGLIAEWKTIGFVPFKQKKSIQKEFSDALKIWVDKSPDKNQDEKDNIQLKLDVKLSDDNPTSQKKVQQKEFSLRKQIETLEKDIAILNNNLGFFSNSKKASTLIEDVQKQIIESQKQLVDLRKQLKSLQQM